MDIFEESLRLHRRKRGKLSVEPKVRLRNKGDLGLAYTPGVASSCLEIAKDPGKAYDLTIKGNAVAIVTDGSAVLGLGNLGPEAALPVMEGKAVLFKRLGGIDAFPICLKTQDPEEIIRIVEGISTSFGGVNLEDIAAPRCFEIEGRLQGIGIPVFHDDQHGTAIVILAAMANAAKVLGKGLGDFKIVINGAGAAGIAAAKLLHCSYRRGVCSRNIILCDTRGMLYEGREGMNEYKEKVARVTNPEKRRGDLKEAVKGADVFIGVSTGDVLTPAMVKSMAPEPIVFALANPVPEIAPALALEAGAAVVGSGRGDYPNQINNMLAFPGVFRGALDAKAKVMNEEMKLAAAKALAGCVKKPRKDRILPPPLRKSNAEKVARAVKRAALKTGAEK
jgi:malate dehydrogenase (oxaloacetate-decarboxylating)